MKRLVDIFFCINAALFLSPIILFVALFLKITSKGTILYWSNRVGKDNKIFEMPKFRTMRLETPVKAKHLLCNPESYLIFGGSFLRKFSLDELPQLWCIFIGDMSFVGPRPALFNQNDLINLRKKFYVDKLVPGLTGWAQVNGRDELPIPLKVEYDVQYLQRQSLLFDMQILALTVYRVLKPTGVSH